MSALVKDDIVDSIYTHKTLKPIRKKDAKILVDAFFAELAKALKKGESVKLSGLGNFQLRDKVTRPGRNPKTGEYVAVPPRRVVTFRAGQKLRTRLETRTELALQEA